MDCSMPAFPVLHYLPEFAQTHVHWVGDAIQQSDSLSSPSPPAFNLSQYQGLSKELVLHIRWPKYCSFSFSISPSNEHSELISFGIDWLDLLADQGTEKLKSKHCLFCFCRTSFFSWRQCSLLWKSVLPPHYIAALLVNPVSRNCLIRTKHFISVSCCRCYCHLLLIFYWSVIALQCCVILCCTTTWIGCMYT